MLFFLFKCHCVCLLSVCMHVCEVRGCLVAAGPVAMKVLVMDSGQQACTLEPSHCPY